MKSPNHKIIDATAHEGLIDRTCNSAVLNKIGHFGYFFEKCIAIIIKNDTSVVIYEPGLVVN